MTIQEWAKLNRKMKLKELKNDIENARIKKNRRVLENAQRGYDFFKSAFEVHEAIASLDTKDDYNNFRANLELLSKISEMVHIFEETQEELMKELGEE